MNLLLFPGAGSSSRTPSLAGDRAGGRADALRARRLPVPQGRAQGARPSTGVAADGARRGRSRCAGVGSCSAADRWAGGSARWPSATPRIRCRHTGLVLISYPLHPPGKPDTLRVEHLPRLDVPCLFIHGTRDPFGYARRAAALDGDDPGRGDPSLARRQGSRSEGCRHGRSPTSVAEWISGSPCSASCGLICSSSRWAVSG